MPLLSSHLLLQSYSATVLLISYLLVTSPLTILHSTSLDLLGASMHIRRAAYVPSMSASVLRPALPSATKELLALLGLVLSWAAITQVVQAGALSHSATSILFDADGKRREKSALGEEVRSLHDAMNRWMTVAALRMWVPGVLVGVIYTFYAQRSNGVRHVDGVLALLANRVTFALAMSDMLFWGYLWTVISQERGELAALVATRRAEDEEDDANRIQ